MHGVAKLSLGCVWLGRLLSVMLGCGFALTSWGNTFTVTNTANSGPGSFNQAITDANTNADLDAINFSISGTPPFTITLTSALPPIINPVVIDATTQPGFASKPVIELNGASTSGIGLRFLVGASTLRGMALGGLHDIVRTDRFGEVIVGPQQDSLFGGVDLRITRQLVVGGEAQYRTINSTPAANSAAASFSEKNLGGTVLRVKLGFRF